MAEGSCVDGYEGRVGHFEAPQVLGRVGSVVEIDGGIDLRHHAPHGLAQERGRGHGQGTAPQLIVDRLAKIETQGLLRLTGGKLTVRGKPALVEKRRAYTRLVRL